MNKHTRAIDWSADFDTSRENKKSCKATFIFWPVQWKIEMPSQNKSNPVWGFIQAASWSLTKWLCYSMVKGYIRTQEKKKKNNNSIIEHGHLAQGWGIRLKQSAHAHTLTHIQELFSHHKTGSHPNPIYFTYSWHWEKPSKFHCRFQTFLARSAGARKTIFDTAAVLVRVPTKSAKYGKSTWYFGQREKLVCMKCVEKQRPDIRDNTFYVLIYKTEPSLQNDMASLKVILLASVLKLEKCMAFWAGKHVGTLPSSTSIAQIITEVGDVTTSKMCIAGIQWLDKLKNVPVLPRQQNTASVIM